MSNETRKLFHVVDASGTDYFLIAESLGDAFHKFKKWIADGDDPDSWEDPQSIHDAGEFIPSSTNTLVEEAGVILAEEEIVCGHKHTRTFAKLSEMRNS